MFRRVWLSAGAGLLMLAVSASSVFAFECYNASRSDAGNEAAGTHSKGLMSFERILADPNIVGLCPAGVDFVVAAVEADGRWRTDVLINGHALMAGGLEKTGKTEKLHDGRGIDHLGAEFFEFVGPLVGQGFGICAAG